MRKGGRRVGEGERGGSGKGPGGWPWLLPCWWPPPRDGGRMAAGPATRSRSGFAIHAVGSTSWACPRASRRRFPYAARPLAAAERAGSGPQHHLPPVPPAAFASPPPTKARGLPCWPPSPGVLQGGRVLLHDLLHRPLDLLHVDFAWWDGGAGPELGWAPVGGRRDSGPQRVPHSPPQDSPIFPKMPWFLRASA